MTRVTFTWEPISAPPGAPVDANSQAARIVLMAATPDGRHSSTKDACRTGRGRPPPRRRPRPAPQRHRLGGSVTFDAPPGQAQLRIVVEGHAAAR